MLTLGKKTLSVPILQGGMGVGVSLGGLAGAVAACGGMGCISTADAGYREPDFARDPASANHRALTAEIRKAKQIANGAGTGGHQCNGGHAGLCRRHPHRCGSGRGRCGIRRGSAAGAARPCGTRWRSPSRPSFPAGGRQSSSCAAGPRSSAAPPILWSLRAARQAVISALRSRTCSAGSCQTLDEILPEVLAEVKPYEAQFGHSIPVFVAGGVYTGADHGPLYQTGCRRRSACHPLYHHLRVRCHPRPTRTFC